MDKRLIFTLIIVASLVASILLLIKPELLWTDKSPKESEESLAKKAAVYEDEGVWNESVTSLTSFLTWMNYTVEKLDSTAINFGSLNGFSVICIPGGDMYTYTEDINIEGRRNIRNFIEEGGGYLGIFGGAYFSLNKVVWRGRTLPMETLRLVSGTAIGHIDELSPYPKYTMIEVTSTEQGKSFFNDLNEEFWVLYYWGPTLHVDENSPASILGVYADNELPAIVTSKYGKGRLVLLGLHPEIEEDRIIDGSTWGSELDEKGSDWPRLKRLIKWLDN